MAAWKVASNKNTKVLVEVALYGYFEMFSSLQIKTAVFWNITCENEKKTARLWMVTEDAMKKGAKVKNRIHNIVVDFTILTQIFCMVV